MTEAALDPQQQAAVDACIDMDNRLVAVTGEAGTGKTTIIRTVCDGLTARNVSFALAAPTGKAARRITEATGYPAITIHKLLAFNRPDIDNDTGEQLGGTRPAHTKENPLSYQVVLVDEYAMVSTSLHRDLVDALGKASMRVFGDIRQLPPIENGDLADPTSPFERCLKMKNAFYLDKVYRQAEGNGILEAARAINRGSMFPSNPDVRIVSHPSMVMKLFEEVRKEPALWGTLDHQIISPARKSDVGTVKLNGVLQSIINPAMREPLLLPRNKWDKSKVTVALDDKVVCTSNTYDMRDFNERFEVWEDDITPDWNSYIPCPPTKQMLNGEVGRIVAIGLQGEVEIDFGDRVVEIPIEYTEYSRRHNMLVRADARKNLELAYALTTHKCQGSEYRTVAYVMAAACFFNLSRQNFYTGLTRAKHNAIIFTDQRALSVSLSKHAVVRKPNGN